MIDHDSNKDDDKSYFENAKLSSLVRKARRRTILRNSAISLVTTLIILAGGWFANLQLQYRSANHALDDLQMLKSISGPNLYQTGSRIHYGFLRGELEYRNYKLIEGVPVIWGEESYSFSSWGTFSRPPGDYSDLSLPDTVIQHQGIHYQRPFNSYNGQREMMFYLPTVQYDHYLNEIPKLDDTDGRELAELGVSFDKNYTVEQIKAMLPTDVHPVWYWVDTYSDLKSFKASRMPDGSVIPPFPDSASRVYGFGVHPETSDISEKEFMDAIDYGAHHNKKYKAEFRRIYNYLRKDKDRPDASDIRLFGVVVTGTVDNLKKLQGQSYVKAAVLGAIVDK